MSCIQSSLTITANQSPSTAIFPVQVYTEKGGWTNQFALFASEYTTISTGIVGTQDERCENDLSHVRPAHDTVLVGKPAGAQ